MNKGWSGDLSHPNVLPNNAHYMGILSQFSNTLAPTIASSKGSIEAQRILIVLSGPEPMRSQLAYLLWRQIQDMTNYQFVCVAGNPKATVPIGVPSHIQFYSHLKADALGCEFQRAALVVCRSGYSTVMDLAVLQKKALLIPTPGQTEQMYLAQYLSSKGIGYCTSQQHVFLPDDIKKALLTLNMSTVPDDYELYQKVLDCLLP
jgi:UDP:flavonoid glycosyltransferase YjiC (YdhE family)